MEELKEEYKRWSDPVGYFVAKRCEFSPKLWISKAGLYDAYKEFAEDENLPIVREELFGMEIKKLPRVRTERKRVQGALSRVWVGIGLKPSEGGDPSDPSDPRDYILRKSSDLNIGNKIEDREFFRSIEVPGSPGSPGSASGGVDKETKEEFYAVGKTGNSGNLGNRDSPAHCTDLGGPGGPSGPRVSVLLKNLELNESNGGREFFRSIEVPVPPVPPRAECCANCQEYQPDYQLCALDGASKDPGFSCQRFAGKPPAVNAPNSSPPPPAPPQTLLYRCKCGCGPWRDPRIAKEHLEFCKGEPGHELQEVRK